MNINSVLGSGRRRPEDALDVERRARELGLKTSVGLIHDGHGQLQPLDQKQLEIFRELKRGRQRSWLSFERYECFQSSLARGLPNEWRCRAGSRYLYICEDGLVHWCSQQRGRPGIPLEHYTQEDLDREYLGVKACAPYCTISCVHRVSILDQFRDDPRASLDRFFPPSEGETNPDMPVAVRLLAWLFVPRKVGA